MIYLLPFIQAAIVSAGFLAFAFIVMMASIPVCHHASIIFNKIFK